MNVFGMGFTEMVVILLVAFLALGPNKSIDMARTTGKVLRDLRSTFNDVVSAVNLDVDDSPARRPSERERPDAKDSPESDNKQP